MGRRWKIRRRKRGGEGIWGWSREREKRRKERHRRGQRLTRQFAGKPILVPLTTSLYVPGTLADIENVIVDVGTGFYVEKVRSPIPIYIHVKGRAKGAQSTKDAMKFYEAKVEELGANLKDLEAIVQQKSNNLRVVEDGTSHKSEACGYE